MSPFLSTTMRRFSRSGSFRTSTATQPSPTSFAQVGPTGTSSLHSQVSHQQPGSANSSTHGHGHSQSLGGTGSTTGMGPSLLPSANHDANHSRPISSATDQSFDFANRPVTSSATHGGTNMPMSPTAFPSSGNLNTTVGGSGGGALATSGSAIGNLSRTDQIVLKHFWEYKFNENCKRDLHYLQFPFFPQVPTHKDLLPYCEIYHLVKTSPGATIISLGSANGVYIGFELQTGSQLHIDMDDEWHNISHYRVQFKSYDNMVRDPTSDATFRTWPKPLTIEFLEEQYQKWCLDLMSLCWEGKEVRELGGGSSGSGSASGHGGSNGTTNGNPRGGISSPISGETNGKRGF